MHRQDEFLRPMEDDVLEVRQLTEHIKTLLEERFPQVWVRGEVSNLRRQSSGHVYFSLKDSEAQLSCVLFRGDARRQSFQLENGMDLLLFGSLSVYPPRGGYQLIGRIAIESGRGRLQAEYERLKRQLDAEGLFDSERKRPLTPTPSRIAVVTSPSGAAIRDFVRILLRRGFRGRVVVYPARVQGEQAAAEIAAMLGRAAADGGYDAVVLTRGGGGIEDLWPFNDEALVRAVAACPLPVISAVGHEIDHVLTDYAADVRAETPSGAAEWISSLQIESRQRVVQAARALRAEADSYIRSLEKDLRHARSRLAGTAPRRRTEFLGLRLDDLENRLRGSARERLRRSDDRLNRFSAAILSNSPRSRLALAGQRLESDRRQLANSIRRRLDDRTLRLKNLDHRLASGSLAATLTRGYAVLRDHSGRVLSSSGAVLSAGRLEAVLQDGKVALKTAENADPEPKS